MATHRFVAVVGARVLPGAWAHQVGDVVRFFASRGWGVGSGGARGADAYALHALLACGRAACGRSVVFLPGPVGAWRNREMRSFKAQGGRVVLGAGVGRAALLGRSRRLAQESAGVVAFLFGPSGGSVFTVREAIRSGKPAAVVLAGGGGVLPAFPGGTWAPCSIAGVAAHRWVPGAERPNGEDGDTVPSALHRIFVVPEGEPTGALLAHISSLTQGERLWFEQAVLVGDTVLMPHEALSDTPAFLALPRLRRRFRCSVGEAAGLGELFLALEVGPGVVAHYEREARRYGVEPVLEQLMRLVVQLALVEDVPETDALTDAEPLGDGVDEDSRHKASSQHRPGAGLTAAAGQAPPTDGRPPAPRYTPQCHAPALPHAHQDIARPRSACHGQLTGCAPSCADGQAPVSATRAVTNSGGG